MILGQPDAHPSLQPTRSMHATLFPVRNRLTRRLFRLHRPDGLPLRLVARRIYILPSRQGLTFLLLLLGMLLGSMNYGLSMGYLFTFLLAGMTLATLFATWRNLVGIEVRGAEAEPAFAGEPLRVAFQLAEDQGRPRRAVLFGVPGGEPVVTQVPARGSSQVALTMAGRPRGRHPLGICRAHSEYPLGLFHAWAILDLQAPALVWPRPVGPYPLPAPGGGAEGGGRATRRGAEDFDGLRAHERGESPSRIVWKSLARHGEPLAKGFVAPTAADLWLAWDDLPALDTEARLSQLARWVLDADRAGRPYGLRLPGQRIAPGGGMAHRLRCLNALAGHGGPPGHG